MTRATSGVFAFHIPFVGVRLVVGSRRSVVAVDVLSRSGESGAGDAAQWQEAVLVVVVVLERLERIQLHLVLGIGKGNAVAAALLVLILIVRLSAIACVFTKQNNKCSINEMLEYLSRLKKLKCKKICSEFFKYFY